MKNIVYQPDPFDPQQLDLYLPATTDHPSPLIIWVHGGAWREGSKENCPILPFVDRGYAVASINYRLSQVAKFPAQIEDCKSAVRWLRQHASLYQLDTNRFAAWGSSAGGHLVALLGTTGDTKEFDNKANPGVSSKVQVVIDFFGPTDLLRMEEQSGGKGAVKHNAPDSPESQLIGGEIQKNKDKANRANPITYVSKADPPTLIVHGDADPLVPLQQSELLYQELKNAGVETKLHIVKGGGHGTGFGDDVNKLVEEFLDEHLKTAK